MKLLLTSAILLTIALAFAQGKQDKSEFASQKEFTLGILTRRSQVLKKTIACLEAAKDPDNAKKCFDAEKEEQEKINSDQTKHQQAQQAKAQEKAQEKNQTTPKTSDQKPDAKK